MEAGPKRSPLYEGRAAVVNQQSLRGFDPEARHGEALFSGARMPVANVGVPVAAAIALNNPHSHSAVDDEVLSGGEVIFNQAQYQRSNILRLAFSVQRNAIVDIILGLRRGKGIMK